MKDKKYMLLLYFKKRPRILKPSHNILTPTPPIQSLKTKKMNLVVNGQKLALRLKILKVVNMWTCFRFLRGKAVRREGSMLPDGSILILWFPSDQRLPYSDEEGESRLPGLLIDGPDAKHRFRDACIHKLIARLLHQYQY